MNTNGRAHNTEPNVVTSFSELAHDAIELAELQTQLFALDVKDTSRGARTGLCLAAAGFTVLLGSFPVALVALAVVLIEHRGWSHAGGFGMATLVGVVVAAALLTAAWRTLRTSVVTLHRSGEELNRNITWLKSNLRNRSQSNPTEKASD